MRMISRVEFKIRGFEENPSFITESIGLSPTDTWLKGELIGRSILPRVDNGWEFCLAGSGNEEISTLIEKIIDIVTPAKDLIFDISGSKKQISCVIEMYEEGSPPVFFGSDLLRRVASMEASIDVDIYNLW